MSLKPNDSLRNRSDYPDLGPSKLESVTQGSHLPFKYPDPASPAYGPGTVGAAVPAAGRIEALTPTGELAMELNSAQAFISRVMIGHVQRLEENSKRWEWLRKQTDAPALVLMSLDAFDRIMKERP